MHHHTKASSDVTNTNPFTLFEKWLEKAEQEGLPHANAMTLTTANSEGIPSARIVLLRGLDQHGFVFYTNYLSDKGKQIEENLHAALVFFWPTLNRQVRIEGRVEKVSVQESDNYFSSRPRGHQLSAHASKQSQVIPDRTFLERQQTTVEETYKEKEVPRPDHWGGYRVIPEMIEFWQEGEHRLHDRLRYKQTEKNKWIIERLSP